ncbi:UDP-2,3-diacylglucosamine diphosphatase [Nevskia sp.]|uniref:UDP-2,3-diacylglucosamine diphosphatase n=1 Tax=Nevskia sp. TaxID=1929292 RepID=UPI0025D04912|nr:UDP-2,3-diacylglucosamine diphosphatase [Nevskia sp.]
MNRPILLLSDLHLPNTPSPLRERFLAFLAGPAREAEAVYMLGDLFEVWIGDAEGLADYRSEADALRALRDSGVRVCYQHGNRDFMLGTAFAKAAGLELLADPLIVDLAGEPTLLSHGDIWCTDDLPYQRWRRFSRNPVAQFIYRRLPRAWRQKVAGQARGDGTRNKPAAILDVNADAIRQAFIEHGVARIIHGHTHRPTVHQLDIDGRKVERLVLADWRPEHCEYLQVDDAGLIRKTVVN